MKMSRQSQVKAVRHAVMIGLWSFLLAGGASLASQAGTGSIDMFAAGLVLLLIVILVGILFDIIGVAATVAQEAPLHAKAAHQVFGAKHAVWLVRNAHQVASFCNDVVGDVSGTLSGAIGITLVLKLFHPPTERELVVGTTLMTACIAALVVGGKAYGKVFAIEQGTNIMFRTGQLLACVDRLLPFNLLPPKVRSRSRSSSKKPPSDRHR